MINIIVVEDNVNKQKKIKTLIEDSISVPKSNVDYAADIKAAKKLLYKKSYDFMVLDLVLPLEEGGEAKPENGVNFLDDIHSSPQIKPVIHIVGLTEFSEYFESYKDNFSKHVWHLISYKANESEWQDKLKKILYHLIKVRNDFLQQERNSYDYDVAVVTALQTPELEQVLNLDGNWSETRLENDATLYNVGVFQKGEKRIRVVAASAPQMGMVAASSLCMKLISHFRPKYLIMTGIAAGVKGECEFGDILVADQTYDGTSGKIISDSNGDRHFSPNPTPLALDADLKERLRSYQAKSEYFFDIKKKWQGNKPSSELKLRLGPVVSVPYVIQNEDELTSIRQYQRKLIGLEMESYGVFYSANYGVHPKPKPISIKSVCDFGDRKKADNYQNYAAYTSARFMYDFVLNEL